MITDIQFVVPGQPVGKICSVCNIGKPISEFGKNSTVKSKLMAACRSCVSLRGKEWRSKNPDKASICEKRWKENNKVKAASTQKQYRELNKEKYVELNKEWRSKNKEKHKKLTKEWREKNKLRVQEYEKNRRIVNPELSRVRCRNRAALKKKAHGKHSFVDIKSILTLQKNRCAACRCDVSKKYHVDHIIPLSGGGGNGKENLQILCPLCNMSKATKNNIDFMQSKGMLL